LRRAIWDIRSPGSTQISRQPRWAKGTKACPLPHRLFAVNAWHWLEPETRYGNAARALKTGGKLVLVTKSGVRIGSAHKSSRF
jgi:hypothetical protein